MKAFDEKQQQAASTLPTLEKRVVDDSSKMGIQLERERSIRGNGQRSVERGQISVAIHQLGVDASQARASVNGLLGELFPVAKELVAEADIVSKACAPTNAGATALREPCSRFAEENAAFKRRIDQTRLDFGQFSVIWDRESSAQEHLMKASDAAVN